MPKPDTSVIPIRREIPLPDSSQKVVDVAFDLWLARGFRGGSPAEDLLTAIQEVKGSASAGLFLVPKPNSMRCEVRPFTEAALFKKGAK